jgi:hypothetical protein
MIVFGNPLGYTLSLLGCFLGIGILANLLIFYIVAQVLAEREQNKERKERTQG